MTLAIGQKRGNGIRPYTGRLGRPLGATQGNYRQHSLYVGWVTCLLALLGVGGLALGSMRRDVRRATCDIHRTGTAAFFSIAAFVFWLFSMGRYCEPVYRLVYAMPFGDYLRAPVKWHHLTEFCLCVLAGYGLSSLCSLLRSCASRFAPGAASRISVAVVSLCVLLGVVDLACNDRLFCAPHRADADMQFADVRITKDPRGVAQLNQMRARTIGTYGNAALIEIPRAHDARVPEMPSPQPVTLCLGILSLAGTLAVGAYGARKS